MCLSDVPVALDADAPGGEFTGDGVVDGSFDPSAAGVGIHTISYEAPSDGYMVEAGVFDPIDISTGGATSVFLSDDAVSGAIPLGFTFNFFGTDYTEFYISSNGFLTFNSGSPNGCCTGQLLPNAGLPNNLIAFAWEDLDPGNGGAPVENVVRYQLTGTAPNRVMVVEFFNVDHFSNGNNVTSHIQMYETTNCIEIHTTTMPSDGGSHTMGIEDAAGTEAWVAPGRNSVSWSATADMYSFCPNAPCLSSIDVEVVPVPTVDGTADAEEICLGEEITLDATGTADEYSYGTGIEIGTPFAPTITGENVFVVSATDLLSGCVATDLVTVFVHDIPFVGAGMDTTICSDDEYVLNAVSDDPAVEFTWDNGIEDGEPFMQEVGSVTYTVVGANASGCESSASVTIESLEVPTGTGIITFMTGGAFDGEIDFTPEGGAGEPYEFLWTNGATTEDVFALEVGTYTVTVSDGFCDSDVTFTVDSQAGIDTDELDNLKVYPNPVADDFTIEFEGTYNWTLYDNSGKIVMEGQGTGKELISVKDLTKGTYHVKVAADSKASTVSLVKQ